MANSRCSNCYRNNAADASFCVACGTPLVVALVANPQQAHQEQTKPSHGKQLLFMFFSVAVAIALWEGVKVLPGLLDDALKNRYSQAPAVESESFEMLNPRIVQHNEKGLYGLMKEREMALNRETPRMVNQMLKLTRVKYSPSRKVMSYNFEVKTESLQSIPKNTIVSGLRNRYCSSNEFAELVVNDVAAKFIYWDTGSKVLEVNVRNCD